MKINKTLKRKIHTYISKKGNICCEKDLNREMIIQQIFDVYLKIATFYGEKDIYLDYVSSDLVKLIGYLSELKEIKNTNGVKLWKYIDKLTINNKIKITGKDEITNVLKVVPLYFLLSILGYGHNRIINENITNEPLFKI